MSCECDLCRRRELHPDVYPEKRVNPEITMRPVADGDGDGFFAPIETVVPHRNFVLTGIVDQDKSDQETVDDVYARYYSNDPELADSEGFSGVGTAVAWDNDGKGTQPFPISAQSELHPHAKFMKDWAPGGEKNPRGYVFPVMTAISTGHSPPGSVFTIKEAIQKSIDEGLAKLHAVEAATGVRHVFVHDPDRAYGMKLVPAETRKQLVTCIRHGRTICLVCACAEGNANE